MRTILFGKPILGEEEYRAVQDVLQGPILVHGPKAKEFEAAFAEYTAAPYAISVSSCTAALHLCYFSFGIGKGDEVIVPAQTHVATVHAVELVGATPVFVDAESRTGNLDIDAVESLITERTKAISLVHFLGMPVDMPKLMQIADKHQLKVIEDCALAIGSTIDDTHVGLFGTAGCFSFYPVKHMTTAEGGMIITRDQEFAERVIRERAFGVDRTVAERTMPGMYDVNMLGFNYRMNEIEAAIGLCQLKRMPGFLEARERNFMALRELVEEIEEVRVLQSTHGNLKSSYYCLSVLLSDKLLTRKKEIVEALQSKGVGTSVYYPQAVPEFTYYRNKYGSAEKFPVASAISRASVSLPVGPHLNEDDMKYIAAALKDALS